MKDKLIYDIKSFKYDFPSGNITDLLLNTPIFLNVTISSCTKGFLLMEDISSCSCLVHPKLTNYNINCSVIGNISWTGPLWLGMPEKSVIDALQITGMLARKVSTLRLLMTLMVNVPSAKLGEAARTTIAWLLDLPTASTALITTIWHSSFLCGCRIPASVLHQCLQPHCHSGND